MNVLSSSPGAKLLKNLKIGVKLTLGTGILVALTLIVVGLGWLGSIPATQQINNTGDVRVPTALVSAQAQANLLKMLSNVHVYLALGEAKYRDDYHQSEQAFAANLAELKVLSSNFDVNNKRRLAELEVTFNQWSKLPDTLFELRDDPLEREPAYKLLAVDAMRLGGTILIDTSQLIDDQGQRDATAENIARLADMAQFQGHFAAMLSGLRGYVTTRNRAFQGEYEGNATASKFAWDRLFSRRASLTLNQQATLAKIAQNREAFLLLPDQMFSILESEHWREDLFMFKDQALPTATTMLTLLGEITADQQRLLQVDLNTGRASLADARLQTLIGGIIAVVLGLAMTAVLRENIAGPVRRLTTIAEQIRGGDLEARAQVESRDEIGTLAETFNSMTDQLRRTLLQVRKEKKRADDLLEVVIPIGVELASEKDFNRLLEKMLLEAKTFCHADAGTLYLRTEDDHLKYVIIRDDTQQIALGGTTGQDVPFAPLAMYKKDGTPNSRVLAARAALEGSSFNIANADEAKGFDFSGPSESRVYTDQFATSLLAIPLKNSAGQVLGVMQLMNAQDPETGQPIAFDQNLQRMMESFSSLAVAALEAYIRERSLKQEIQQLRIEIDEVKRQKQVSEIVDTDFFQDLRAKVRTIRGRKSSTTSDGSTDQPA